MQPPKEFLAEYAKSGKAKCVACKDFIPNRELRLGAVFPSYDSRWGDSPRWYHTKCFFEQKFTIPSMASLLGADSLTQNAQDFLRQSILILNGKAPPLAPSRVLASAPGTAAAAAASGSNRGNPVPHSPASKPPLPPSSATAASSATKSSPPSAAHTAKEKGKQRVLSDEDDGAQLFRFRSSRRRSESPPPAPETRPPHARLDSLFLEAVRSANVEEAGRCLSAGANPDAEVTDGVTALAFAAFKGFIDLAKEILKFSPNVDARTKSGETPLFLAARLGIVDMVQLLLNSQADKSVVNSQGLMPIEIAAEKGHENVVELLLEVGAEVPASNSPSSSFALPSMPMADPSASTSFHSNASTQVDDPMQATTFIEPAQRTVSTIKDVAPTELTIPDKKGAHGDDDDDDGQDTFAQQRALIREQGKLKEEQEKEEEPRRKKPSRTAATPPSEFSTQSRATAVGVPPRQTRKDLDKILDRILPSTSPTKRRPSSPAKDPPLANTQSSQPKQPRQPKQSKQPPRQSPPPSGDRLESFLCDIGLDPTKFLGIFSDEEIDFDALLTLQEKHLVDLGIKMGPRNKILAGIAKIRAAEQSSTSGSSQPNRRSGGKQSGEETSETEVSEHEPEAASAKKPLAPLLGRHTPLPPQHRPPLADTDIPFDQVSTLQTQEDDPGYQSTLEISPEKKRNGQPLLMSTIPGGTRGPSASATPDTTLASTIIVTQPPHQGTVSQLLSEIGHSSYSSSRRLSLEKKPPLQGGPVHSTTAPAAAATHPNSMQAPKSPSKSPIKSPSKSFKAPEFNFQAQPPLPHQTFLYAPKQPATTTAAAPASFQIDNSFEDTDDTVILGKPISIFPVAPPRAEKPVAQPEKQGASPVPLRHHIMTHSYPQGPPKTPSKPGPRTEPSSVTPPAHLNILLRAVRRTVLDYVSSYSPSNAQTVASSESIQIVLKPSLTLKQPAGFVTVVNEGGEDVKLTLTQVKNGSALQLVPKTRWISGTTYTLTLHADHVEAIDTETLKDSSWSFFVN